MLCRVCGRFMCARHDAENGSGKIGGTDARSVALDRDMKLMIIRERESARVVHVDGCRNVGKVV